jgi:hypothetical protein
VSSEDVASGDDNDENANGVVNSKKMLQQLMLTGPIPYHTMDNRLDPSEIYAKSIDRKLHRMNSSRWRKALKERRALRDSCELDKDAETIVEAAHATNTTYVHLLKEPLEVIAENNIYTRRYVEIVFFKVLRIAIISFLCDYILDCNYRKNYFY